MLFDFKWKGIFRALHGVIGIVQVCLRTEVGSWQRTQGHTETHRHTHTHTHTHTHAHARKYINMNWCVEAEGWGGRGGGGAC